MVKQQVITIYLEPHIWPYYTHIRSFRDVSFKYPVNPVKLNCLVFALTNTYRRRGRKKKHSDLPLGA